MARGVRKAPVDTSLLSKEDLAAIDDAERLAFEADQKEKQKDEYRKEARRKVREANHPDEKLYNITIDLAPYTDRIILDGVHYLHGRTYQMNSAQCDTVSEIMQRTWWHQEEIDGKNTNEYRTSRAAVISPMGVTTRATMRGQFERSY